MVDLSGIKKNNKDVMREYVDKEPKFRNVPKDVKTDDNDKKESKVKSVFHRKQKEHPKWKEESALNKEQVKFEKNKLKLERLKVKADIAKQKSEIRKSSAIRSAGAKFLEKAKQKPTPQYRTTKVVPGAYIERERAVQRKQMEYEQEYHKKFGARKEGDNELPYYEKEHGRPLTPPCKVAPKITITNGERIPKKKSLKDELL